MKSARFLFFVLGLGIWLLTACPSPTEVKDAIGNIEPSSIEMAGSPEVSPTTTFSFKNVSSNAIKYTIEESLDWLDIITGASGTGRSKQDSKGQTKSHLHSHRRIVWNS